jgi:hypothetical protein
MNLSRPPKVSGENETKLLNARIMPIVVVFQFFITARCTQENQKQELDLVSDSTVIVLLSMLL